MAEFQRKQCTEVLSKFREPRRFIQILSGPRQVGKTTLMQQLFRLGCFYSAEILSLTKLLGQLQDAGTVTTLASYLGILSEAHLLTGLQNFVRDESRKYRSPPKFQVFNNALLSAYRSTTFDSPGTSPLPQGIQQSALDGKSHRKSRSLRPAPPCRFA